MKISSKVYSKAIAISVLILSFTVCTSGQSGVPALIEKGKYKLLWADEFEKDGLPDTANWSYEHGFVRNEELQRYQNENAKCKDGFLVIEGRKENIKNDRFDSLSTRWQRQRKFAEYSSASLNTRNKMHFQYGITIVRAKIDTSMGMWPAIWTLGIKNRWPANGEIDIMEFYRVKNKAAILANFAWMGNGDKAQWDDAKIPLSHFTSKNPNWSNEFHIWTMKWTETVIELFLDDELLNSIEMKQAKNPDGYNPFDQPHYILLNLAIGGNGGDPSNTSFPKEYKVDYVRVYQKVNK